MDSLINVTPISKSLYPSAAHLVAASFYDNPAHIYLCPNEKTRMEQLTWLLGVNLKLQLSLGAESFCIADNTIVHAMGFWTKPNQVKIGFAEKVKGGLLKVPFKMGFSGFKRVLEVSAEIENHLHKTMGTKQTYRYLNNMVIKEDIRGKGLGTSILKKQFSSILAKEKGAIFALSTQRYWTVKFYERLGFEVLLEEKIGHGELAFPNWTMRKV